MNNPGIILLNKRSGVTSFDEIRYLKKRFGFKKIGHAGTLDKFAEGVLIILLGPMTKFSQYFLSLEKSYDAQVVFGIETDTLDPEGDVIARSSVPTESDIQQILPEFHGTISQVPPAYSAVHVNGVRAYQAARDGKSLDIPVRRVEIHECTLRSWKPPVGNFFIRCSKGTYIRSLARDLALRISSRAYVQELRRTSIGPFPIEQTVSSQDFDPKDHIISEYDAIARAFPVEDAVVAPEHQTKLKNGLMPKEAWMVQYRRTNESPCFLRISNLDNERISWYRRVGNSLQAIHVQSGGQQ